MKRVKKHIIVLVTADRDQVDAAIDSAKHASIYANVVYVAVPLTGRIDEVASIVAAVPQTKLVRVSHQSVTSTRYRDMAYAGMKADLIGDVDRHVVMFLEAGQHVDEPEIVRDSIERHDGKILTALRQFQWDNEHYRVDGIYVPARFPVVGEFRLSSHWDEPLSTAPAWMWSSSTLWVEASFSIIDPTYMNPDNRINDGAPKLEPTRGRLFV